MEQNESGLQNQHDRESQLRQLISSNIGLAILRYAKNDKTNKIPMREDRIVDNIARVLRSPKAMKSIGKNTPRIEERLAEFRKEWNDLSPLYPNQANALRRNHSSGGNLENESSKRIGVRVIGEKSDSELWKAVEWFTDLSPRSLPPLIKKLYRERSEKK